MNLNGSIKFERGKDPRETMSLGSYADPIVVEGIYQDPYYNSIFKFVLNATECSLFMQTAENGFVSPVIPGHPIYHPDAHMLKITVSKNPWKLKEVSIREMEGRVLKLRDWDKLYKVAKVQVKKIKK